jgi:hypothetical protein
MKRLTWHWQLFVLISAFIIVILRKPDAVFNPQFWAEDGAVWYASAYNLGVIRSVFLPLVGYFQTFSRLTAAFVQMFPLSYAPLIFNLIAIFVEVLPVPFLLSSRFAAVIPRLDARILIAFLYLAIPNSWEVHANLTNAHWHLALLAFMVLIATPSITCASQMFDRAVVLASGLSGPFSLFLMPLRDLSG